MVSDPRFADAIKAKIGSAVDTNDLEKQLEALQAQLRQTLGTKARLERQMDGLDVNDPYYDRKISDLQRRYDEQYGAIDEIEVQIDDVQKARYEVSGRRRFPETTSIVYCWRSIRSMKPPPRWSGRSSCGRLLSGLSYSRKSSRMATGSGRLSSTSPVPVNGAEVKRIAPLENETMVETVVLLSPQKARRTYQRKS